MGEWQGIDNTKGEGVGEVSKEGYQEVKLETGGEWAPYHVFRSMLFDEIIQVSDDLIEKMILFISLVNKHSIGN